MVCKHEFNYIGEQKGKTTSNRYYKCALCGCVKVRTDNGTDYLIPGPANNQQK